MIYLAIAPIIFYALYIYIRDKYEKEPIRLLLTGILFGIVISVPIGFCEKSLERFIPYKDLNRQTILTNLINLSGTADELSFEDQFLLSRRLASSLLKLDWINISQAFYISFFIAALCEETFKFIILYFLIWTEKNFNEPFDGIVYSVMISLGFAMAENILYVINPKTGGLCTALTRAVISVPGHMFFAITMGYFFALAKYEPNRKISYIVYALAVPIFLHGLFDFILLCNIPFAMLIFICYMICLYVGGQKKMNIHLERSPFKVTKKTKRCFR